MVISRKHIPRRAVLKGLGATVALPFLEAMVPARASAQAARGKLRFAAIEMVHGSAGSTAFGIKKNMWAPADVGRAFDLSPSSLAPLEPFRNDLTIISNTDVRNAEAFTAPEIGGDHFRSSAVFLTSFTESLMTYALGRRLEYTDMPAVRAIVRDAGRKGDKLSAYVLAVVNSPAFKMGVTDSNDQRRAAEVERQR